MAKIGADRTRRLEGFTGGDEYNPPVEESQPARKEPAKRATVAAVTRTETAAERTPPVKPVRKNWMFSPEFINDLLESKVNWVHEGRDEGRHIRYSNLAEQAWIAALAAWAMEKLEEDLKHGSSHGIAGEIHEYFPANSRAVRGYR